MINRCCWDPEYAWVITPCGRKREVCMSCDAGIDECTEGYCRHKKESVNDH